MLPSKRRPGTPPLLFALVAENGKNERVQVLMYETVTARGLISTKMPEVMEAHC